MRSVCREYYEVALSLLSRTFTVKSDSKNFYRFYFTFFFAGSFVKNLVVSPV